MLPPRVRRLFGLDLPRRARIAAELEDELQMHLEMRAAQLERQGMSPAVAMAQARARFGGIEQARRDIHRHAFKREQRMKRHIAMHSLGQDVRFALRTLGRQKLWTMVAVLTLALGIGANTAVFSVVNDLLLDPLRYPERDRLVMISRMDAKSGFQLTPTRRQLEAFGAARSLERVEGVATSDYTLASGSEPSTVRAALVSSTFVSFAGGQLLVGRSFLPVETLEGGALVAILSEHLWRARFGSDHGVVGRLIDIDGKKRTIIGVLADGIRLPTFSSEPADVWLPLTPDMTFLSGPVVARLAKGATIAAAKQELTSISDDVGRADHGARGAKFEIGVRVPGSTGSARRSVLLLGGAVCLLLLIACANVAHLLLARGAARQREMAIRAALGAGYGRLLRQLMTESLLLAIGGCLVGLGVGFVTLKLIVMLRPPSMSELANVHIDVRVLMATVVLSMLTGIAFGIVGGLQMRGTARLGILRSSVGATSDRGHHRARSLLVITESALSVVLLVGATLLIRTVINLQHIDPGFDAAGVHTMEITLPDSRYTDPANRTLYASQLLDGARRIPGVAAATIASNIPTRAGVIIGEWVPEGSVPTPTGNGPAFTAMNTVTADYFPLMRMRLLGGRSFEGSSSARNEVIVSKSLGSQLFGGANPVGKRFRSAGTSNASDTPPTWNVVVGVAADANLLGLRENGKMPAIYFPTGRALDQSFTLLVRMRDGFTPDSALRRLSLRVDPGMPAPPVLRLSTLLARTVDSQRFMMALLTLFAGLAVFLSAVGLYGVITYMVSQTSREIGIRVALGAARRHVVRMVMQQGILLSVIGLAIGLLASVWGSAVLSKSLYGVSTTDPLSYIVGGCVLLALAVAACIAPTLRAVRIDPMVAMRGD